MKKNSTPFPLLLAILLFTGLGLFAQPDYCFNSGTLISGTDKLAGAVYKYTNVRAGVDATVTIDFISPGITVTDMDAGSGYTEAFQPTLEVKPFTNGYLEMKFQLLVAGTNTSYTALEMPVTCIDVDGTSDNDGDGNPLYEFDEINLGPGGTIDFNTFGGELLISQNGVWRKGKNSGGIDYPGRDTVARNVMFTVVNTNVSNFTIRVGVDNQSDAVSTRLRSVYFKRFAYSHFPLPLPKIMEFNGNCADNDIRLNWKMESSSEWEQCVLERSDNSGKYASVAVFLQTDAATTEYRYNDKSLATGNHYYRLKLVSPTSEIKYSSILAFKTGNEMVSNQLLVYPSVITDRYSVKFRAEKNEPGALLQMVDYTGKTVYSRRLNLLPGENNISVNDFAASRGNYIVVIRTADKMQTQKIIIQ
jgi:hypothetical protein